MSECFNGVPCGTVIVFVLHDSQEGECEDVLLARASLFEVWFIVDIICLLLILCLPFFPIQI